MQRQQVPAPAQLSPLLKLGFTATTEAAAVTTSLSEVSHCTPLHTHTHTDTAHRTNIKSKHKKPQENNFYTHIWSRETFTYQRNTDYPKISIQCLAEEKVVGFVALRVYVWSKPPGCALKWWQERVVWRSYTHRHTHRHRQRDASRSSACAHFWTLDTRSCSLQSAPLCAPPGRTLVGGGVPESSRTRLHGKCSRTLLCLGRVSELQSGRPAGHFFYLLNDSLLFSHLQIHFLDTRGL